MTIHETLLNPARQPLLAAFFLLLTLQMAMILVYWRTGRNRRLRTGAVVHFMISFGLFYLLLFDIDWNIVYPNKPVPSSTVFAAFGSVPVTWMILYEALTALLLTAAFLDLLRYRKNHPTFESIKEMMDLLPAGIAFGMPEGTAVFSNLTMNRLSRSLTGKGVKDLTVFRNIPHGKALKSTESAGSEKGAESVMQISLPDGTAEWQFTEKCIDVNGETFTQLIATDITKQSVITKELEEKNKMLRSLHMHLNIYNREAERIIISQELLTARMVVHNEVGNVLLESRHYLKDPDSYDEEILLQALKNTNTYLLREYEEDDTARDPLTDSMEMAQAIGVDVEITGVIPFAEPFRKILAAAISECASNTVKHANGDCLCVTVQNTDEEMAFLLQNNGEQPGAQIHESGGLLSLRCLVEQAHGTMQTETAPAFVLTIRVPKEH